MADEDLPPSLRSAEDVPPSLRRSGNLPPSLRASEDVPPSLRNQQPEQSTFGKIWDAAGLPMRALRARNVAVEDMFTGGTGSMEGNAAYGLLRAREAFKPDYKPPEGEKLASFSADMADPRFLGLGAVGEATAAKPLIKMAMGGATGMGGTELFDEMSKGNVDMKKVGASAAIGAAGGAALHGAGVALDKGIELASKPLQDFRKAFSSVSNEIERHDGSFVNWLTDPKPNEPPKPSTPGQPDAKLTTLPVIDHKTFDRKEPYALFQGNMDFGDVKLPQYIIRGEGPYKNFNQGIDFLEKNNIPVLGREPARSGLDPNEMPAGPTPDAVFQQVMSKSSEGKLVQAIAEETGLPAKAVQQAKNMNPPIETAGLEVHDKATAGDPVAQLTIVQRAQQYWLSSPSEASSMAKNLYKRRYEDIGLGYLESRLFIKDSVGKLSDLQRQALPFIVEGKLPDPQKFNHPQATEIIQLAQDYLSNPAAGFNREMARAHEMIGKYFEEGHAFLKDNFDQIGYHENYVNHLWDRNPQTSSYGPSATSLSEKNPFAKQRYIGSYAEGINEGLSPKTLDMAELLKTYDNYKIKAVANKRFRDMLEDIKVENGAPAVLPLEKAPPNWKYVDSHFFTGVKVHPDVFPAVRAIVERPFSMSDPGPKGTLGEKMLYQASPAYEKLNAITKSIKLMGVFHYVTLTLDGLAAGINPLRVGVEQAANVWKHAEWDGLRDLPGALLKSMEKGHAVFQNLPLAKDAIGHGLLVGSVSDVQRGIIARALTKVEQKISAVNPVVGKVISGYRTFNDVYHKALWDYFHAGIKLSIYESHLSDNLAKFGDKMPLEQIKRETAEFTNKSVGGALERLMYSPKYTQMLHWAFMAPDWTLTRVQTAGAMFKGISTPQSFQARKFWLRSALAFYSSANVWNYVNTQKAGLKGKYGEGRFLWENDPGHALQVFRRKDDTGRNEYIHVGKTFTEVADWFQNPRQTLGNKAAPVLQAVAEGMQGGERTITGYPIPPEEQGLKASLKRNLTPMSLSGQSYGGVFPISHGTSKTQVINLFQKGLENNDQKSIEKAIKWGVENGHDVKTLAGIATRNYKAELKKKLLKKDQ